MQCPKILREFITKTRHVGFFPTVKRALALLVQRAILCLRRSHAQYGEDLEINRLLGGKKEGFYVDVGAYDPVRLSNTYYFYKKGWRGITIEPDPGNAAQFQNLRPEDLHLNIGLGPEEKTIPFYKFESKTRSTFSREEAEAYQKQGLLLDEIVECPVKTLASVLAAHLADQEWDLLSLDTEGYEIPILQGNDWDRFRPRLICVEGYENDTRTLAGATREREDLRTFLESKGYKKVYDNYTNCIYFDGEHR